MKTAVYTVLAIASVGSALAQRPTPPARHTPAEMEQRQMDHLASSLVLTDAQKEKATSIYHAANTSTATLRDSNKTAHQTLRTAIEKNDTVSIDKASLQLGNLMAQEMSVRSKADAAFRQTLTVDQQAKFDKMHMGGRGPGGPGGFAGAARGHRPPPPSADQQ